MYRRILAVVGLAFAFLAALLIQAAPASATTTHLRRVFVIMMENQGFDDVIGHLDSSGHADTPFITHLAQRFGLATYSFGTTHPSLPNYLSLVAGATFNVADDNPSCFAVPAPGAGCHAFSSTNIVDELESKLMTWEAFEQSMPTAGYLGAQFPTSPNGPVLYAQKHNPFVYFKDIATSVARRAHIVPLDERADQLRAALANPIIAPQYVFIVPDQCHDMHGTTTCPSGDALLRAGDAYLQTLVQTIVTSPSYTPDSAIFITWDENDFSSNIGCCLSPTIAGGHVATIVVTPRYTQPLETALPTNHYTTLRTIEDELGIPGLGHSAFLQPTLLPLLP